jgi:hypothetical protein
MVTTANLWNVPRTPTEIATWSLANRVDHDEIRNAIARKSSVVQSITVESSGTGYTTAPYTIIGAPDLVPGVQATATASLSSSGEITVTLTNAGLGYSNGPTVSFLGGGGSGASALAVVNYVRLFAYPLDPIPQNGMDQWFTWHQQTQEDMLNVLNLPGSDQESLDFNNYKETEHWMFLHIQDHISCRQALGI